MMHLTPKKLEMENDEDTLTRRLFLTRLGVGAVGLAWALPGRPRPVIAKEAETGALPIDRLEKSAFVYVSPLLGNGEESSCHAELWFAWIDDSIIVTVAKDRWKAKALDRGLTGAHIWVGDHGRWKRMLGGHNEDFRTAPNFIATAEKVDDPKMIDRLLAVYSKKYPNEIGKWSDRMRSGNADGSRIMIRYRPGIGGTK
jgi:hypothetical protein